MKLMLIQAEPPDETEEFNFPMGYAALDSVLTKHGHEVELLFTVAHYLTDDKIARAVRESDAQVIGIGGMWPYLQRVEALVGLVREAKPDATVVLGGWMTTYLPELVLEKTSADFCVSGEGENALLQLLNGLDAGEDCSGIKGLVFRREGETVNNGFGEVMSFEDIPMPNWDKFPMEWYMRIGPGYFQSFAEKYDRVVGWAASRGCPGQCNFCTPGVGVRYKTIDLLMQELREIHNRFHPTFVYWMDNLTMGSKGYCERFCEALIREKFGFRYFITGRADIVDRDMLALLKESGCACILYGLESANNELLEFMNKRTTVEQVVHAIKLTKEANIGVNVSAMFGQPGETVGDFGNTLQVALTASDRKMPYSNNQSFSPLTTFPGAPIYDWAKENGYIKDDEDYYEQFFRDRWINYTAYPREVVEHVLEVGNLLNVRNYHQNVSGALADKMRTLVTLGQAVLDEKRFVRLRRFLRAVPPLRALARMTVTASASAMVRLRALAHKTIQHPTGAAVVPDDPHEAKRAAEHVLLRVLDEYVDAG